MIVEIRGATIGNFVVTITDTNGHVEDFNIHQLLTLNESELEREMAESASMEHMWHQLAIDAEYEKDQFEKIQYTQFMAHAEKYARYYLKSVDKKEPSGAAKESAVVRLFSDGVNHTEAAVPAFKGYTEEARSVGVKPMTLEEFQDEMFQFGPTYEDAVARLLSLQYKANQLRAISAAFNTKSWSVKTMAANERAKLQSNI